MARAGEMFLERRGAERICQIAHHQMGEDMGADGMTGARSAEGVRIREARGMRVGRRL